MEAISDWIKRREISSIRLNTLPVTGVSESDIAVKMSRCRLLNRFIYVNHSLSQMQFV